MARRLQPRERTSGMIKPFDLTSASSLSIVSLGP
jgi:hypothetical protein